MSRIDRYRLGAVDSFPTPLEPGVLYVSTKYSTAAHLCACGCGREVITKLSPARYRVTFDGEVSLAPSVASTGLPCNSHYFITRGAVHWHRKLDNREVDLVRAADLRAVELQRARVWRRWVLSLRRFGRRLFR